MRKTSLSLVAAAGLALTGCIDADMTATINGADQAEISGVVETSAQMLSMMGGPNGFCDPADGGVFEAEGQIARCTMSHSGSFAEIFEAEGDEPAPTAEDLGNGTVRVTFPFAEMSAQMAEIRNDQQALSMVGPMLQGRTVVMRVAGAEIIETNGTLADDGASASVTFNLEDILDPNATLPGDFISIVRY